MKVNSTTPHKQSKSNIYSVMLVPESSDKIIQFHIKKWTIPVLVGIFLAAFAGVSIYAFYITNKLQTAVQQVSREEQIAMEAAFSEQEKKLKEQQDTLTSLKQQTEDTFQYLKNLIQQENEIRATLGMEPLTVPESLEQLAGEKAMPTDIAESWKVDTAYLETAQKEMKETLTVQTQNLSDIQERIPEYLEGLKALPKKYPVTNTSKILYHFGDIKENSETGETYQGMILSTDTESRVLAAGNGTIISAGTDDAGVTQIIIDHGNGYKSYYLNYTEAIAAVGQEVKKGDEIAKMGEVSTPAGPLLEFRVSYQEEYIDPETMLTIVG